jgi:hypothetical protein
MIEVWIGLEANVGRKPQIDAPSDLPAEKFLVPVERSQDAGDILAPEWHNIDSRELEIRAHADVRDRHDLSVKGGIADIAAGQKLTHGVAHKFADAQHALRGLAALLVMKSRQCLELRRLLTLIIGLCPEKRSFFRPK